MSLVDSKGCIGINEIADAVAEKSQLFVIYSEIRSTLETQFQNKINNESDDFGLKCETQVKDANGNLIDIKIELERDAQLYTHINKSMIEIKISSNIGGKPEDFFKIPLPPIGCDFTLNELRNFARNPIVVDITDGIKSNKYQFTTRVYNS